MITEAVYILTGSNSGNRDQLFQICPDNLTVLWGGLFFPHMFMNRNPGALRVQNAFLNQVVLINSSMDT